jgi:hypothetical protein
MGIHKNCIDYPTIEVRTLTAKVSFARQSSPTTFKKVRKKFCGYHFLVKIYLKR